MLRLRRHSVVANLPQRWPLGEYAGHGVIVCARLSDWPLPVYARSVFIASNRHTARRYFRCMGELGSPKSDRPKRVAARSGTILSPSVRKSRVCEGIGSGGQLWDHLVPRFGSNPRACEGVSFRGIPWKVFQVIPVCARVGSRSRGKPWKRRK